MFDIVTQFSVHGCWGLIAGRMKGLAFIKDPDGYWIEIFDRQHLPAILA